ncbi:hypothetical protein AJ79_01628 [Helicocarpus griseus UAMH5409]|uniref:Cytochrome P450 monooxygenase n=1 Tax=Helicocarpus griseus UAMH5409 TaxID=1447875 RepID=A0A2B7Y665_9EURO|nr:hypothetical protein AJ79_01628 [Helicocarpus griseus UAMH5409]
MSLLAVLGLTAVESYALQRTVLQDSELTLSGIALRLLAVNLFLKLFYHAVIWPRLLSPLRHLPQVKGSFMSAQIMFDQPRGKSPLKWMKTIPNDGLLHWRDTVGNDCLLATNHAALLDIMSTNTYDFQKPGRVAEFLARVIGYGLILSEGATHKKHRKALNPAFNIKNIRALYGLMWEKTGLFLEGLEGDMKKNPWAEAGTSAEKGVGKVEMSEWASRLTLDIIGPAAMGRDFRSMQSSEHAVADAFMSILEPTKEKIAFLGINFIFPQWFTRALPWKLNKVITNTTGVLRSLCLDIVREKRATLISTKATAKELETDILGTMMVGGDFTDDELVDQMLTFLAAGHETTASALTWACYLLTKYPEVQTRLREEIRARIPTGDSPITYADLESLPLLNGVCQEVLRLYPTVPMTVREAVRDTSICGKFVPKGTRIFICPYAINRSPTFWGDNGDQFLPERWIDIKADADGVDREVVNHNGGASTNFAQITFLHGQRSCIGKDFARAELRCAVAGVVGRFRFEMQDPKQEIHIAGAVTTKPVEGMHLKMERVEGW